MIKPGIYQHYKGNEYAVIALAKHSETEEDLVVYKALYGNRGVWVRPLAMFEENVVVNDQTIPRFKYLRAEE